MSRPVADKILDCLRAHRDEFVPWRVVVLEVWGEDEFEEEHHNVLKVTACRLRRAGYVIEGSRRTFARGYKLVSEPVAEARAA